MRVSLSASMTHLNSKILPNMPPKDSIWCQNGARGAGGRGRSPFRPHPAGCDRACQGACTPTQVFQVLEDLQGGPPLPLYPPKSSSKSDQKSNQKNYQIFDPKWPPKGTVKISKIWKNLQNGSFERLSRALSSAFVSERVPKSSPRTSRTSKMTVLLW